MSEDEIVEETRRIRKAYASQFEDLVALCRDLQQKEAKSKHKLVSFPPRKPVIIRLRKSAESAVAEEKGKYGAKKNG
jgi:hypothetical protein